MLFKSYKVTSDRNLLSHNNNSVPKVYFSFFHIFFSVYFSSIYFWLFDFPLQNRARKKKFILCLIAVIILIILIIIIATNAN